MTWNLFIDDERNPKDVTWAPWQVCEKYRNEEWEITRNHNDVIYLIEEKGMPSYISFDQDLGDFKNSDGYKIAKYIVELDIYTDYKLPQSFSFYVHSKNPIGKANIEGLLNGYLKAKNRAEEVPCDERRFDNLYNTVLDDGQGDITVGKLKE